MKYFPQNQNKQRKGIREQASGGTAIKACENADRLRIVILLDTAGKFCVPY
jgi:hypothetical protein